jgi:hypothetical protein
VTNIEALAVAQGQKAQEGEAEEREACESEAKFAQPPID